MERPTSTVTVLQLGYTTHPSVFPGVHNCGLNLCRPISTLAFYSFSIIESPELYSYYNEASKTDKKNVKLSNILN